MKQYWQRLALKIDMLTLRERVIIFGMATLILLTLVNTAFLDPLFAQQKKISQRIKQDQASIAGLQSQMQQKTEAQGNDPDRVAKDRLKAIEEESARMRTALQDMQKGLVSPDRMSELLGDMLKQNNNLRLVSLKTLPASPLLDDVEAEEKLMKIGVPAVKDRKDQKQKGGAAEIVYKHGVEIVVQGEYLDITKYLAQLEAMPWHLFWHQAKLSADYPKSTLTLTLFTLSLDKKWLNF